MTGDRRPPTHGPPLPPPSSVHEPPSSFRIGGTSSPTCSERKTVTTQPPQRSPPPLPEVIEQPVQQGMVSCGARAGVGRLHLGRVAPDVVAAVRLDGRP